MIYGSFQGTVRKQASAQKSVIILLWGSFNLLLAVDAFLRWIIFSSLIQNGVELGEFRSDIDSDATAAALVGTWDALLLQAWFDDNFDPVTTAENFMTVVINGLVRIHHVE